MGVARVVPVHQAHLAEMNGLDTDVDIAGGQKVEPHACFQPAHVRNRAASPPVIHETPVGVEHVAIPEMAILDRQTELVKHVLRYRDRFNARSHDLELGGLQDDFGITLVKQSGIRFRRLQKRGKLLLPSPDDERPPDKLGPARKEQPHIVSRIDSLRVARLIQIIMEKLGERDRPLEIVFQDRPRDRSVELEVLGESRRNA